MVGEPLELLHGLVLSRVGRDRRGEALGIRPNPGSSSTRLTAVAIFSDEAFGFSFSPAPWCATRAALSS